MKAKCYFQDRGFCKYDLECRFQHSYEVCQERNCRSKSCPKRHPRPCRKFFLKGYCRFGQLCRYSHNFDCEACENFKFLMKKEMKKVDVIVKEKDDLIDITKRDISEANSEIFRLKRDMSNLVKEL